MAARTLDSETISNITRKENELTGTSDPVKGGPTAQAQKHARENISDSQVVGDIVKGEDNITRHGGPVAGGPGAYVMSEATNQGGNAVSRDL